jgi:hypothetical protein
MKKIILVISLIILSTPLLSFAQSTSSYNIGVPDMQKFCWGGHAVSWYKGYTKNTNQLGTFWSPYTHLRFFYTDNGSQAGTGSTSCIPFSSMEANRSFKAYATEGWVGVGSQSVGGIQGNMDGVDRCNSSDTLSQCQTKVVSASGTIQPYFNSSEIWALNFFGDFTYLTNRFSYVPPSPATTTPSLDNSQMALVLNAFSQLFGSTVNASTTDTALLNSNSYGSASLSFMSSQFLIALGSALGMLSSLLPYILCLTFIGEVVYFVYRAFRFIRH